MLSTIGSFVLAAGFFIALLDLLLHLRPAGKVDTNPWNAGTLEWLPLDNYGVRSIPVITSREPLWSNPKLREEVDRGQHYLPNTVTGNRETIVTSAIDARPEYLLKLPGPSWLPVLAGVGTAAFFMFLTVKWIVPSIIGGVVAIASMLKWLWQSEPEPTDRLYPVGGGLSLPDHMTGSRSHSWWAMVVLMLVDGTIFACLLFAFFYLWTITQVWPEPPFEIPSLMWTLVTAALWAATSAIIAFATRRVTRGAADGVLSLLLLAAGVLTAVAFWSMWQTIATAEVMPSQHAYGAVIHTMLAWQGLHVVLMLLMGGYTIARNVAGLVNERRRNTFDNTRIMWHYSAAQALVALTVLQLPRVLA
jgi:cytochrome c oxidase subunit I+III